MGSVTLKSKCRKALRRFLSTKLSLKDLQIMCFDLALDIESLPQDKTLLIIEILTLLNRKDREGELIEWLLDEGIEYGDIAPFFSNKDHETTFKARKGANHHPVDETYAFLLWKIRQLELKLAEFSE